MTSQLARLTLLHLTKPKLNHFYCVTRATSSAARLYTEKHEWIALLQNDDHKKSIGRVGISNHAQEALGDVVYFQAPEIDSKVAQFDEVGAIESVKAASELVTPVSGTVVAVNTKLDDKPSLVNSDCYGEGWLFEIHMDNPKELENLMDEEAYNQFLSRQ